MSELPADLVAEVERLTRLARHAVDDGERDAYERRRAELLDERGFTARVRDEDDVLVLYPSEWIVDGTVEIERIDDTDRAVEMPLSGTGDEDAWEGVERDNADLVRAVEAEHGSLHAANARSFADFLGNHYVQRIDDTTAEQVSEFLSEYYPRNAWPSREQKAVIEESLELLFAAADTDVPGYDRP